MPFLGRSELNRKFKLGMWNFGFRNASGITKFEFRNSKFEIPQFVKGTEGFTLIELTLVIIVISILAATLIPPFYQGVKSYSAVETRGDLTSQARQAATRMVRELRNIQKEANNTPNITIADAATITFVDVLDNDIRFYLSAGALRREDIDTSADNILADNTTGLQIRYFNGSNAELTTLPLNAADRDNVRRILLVLTLTEGDQTVSLTEQAFLRELSGY